MVVYAKSNDMIHIGRVGENKATTVAFDVTDWIEEFGEGNANLIIEKDGKIYPRDTFKVFREGYKFTGSFFNKDWAAIKYYYNSKTKPGYSFYFDARIDSETVEKCVANINLFTAEGSKKVKITDSKGNIYYNPITYIFNNEDFLNNRTLQTKEIINGVETSIIYIPILNAVQEKDFEEIEVKETDGNLILWEVSDTDLKEAGVGKCMLDYRVNDVIVKSVTYAYIVTNSIGARETTEPEEYNWVELILNKANYIENNIEGSHISASEAEAWAIGSKNGIAVKAGEDQYHNNAKYWANEADKDRKASAQSAQESKISEKTSRLWAIGDEDLEDTTENIDYSINNSKYFYEQAVQQKELAEGAAADAEIYKDEAMAIAFGGEDAAAVVQGLINEAMNKSVTIYNWTSALLS